MNQVEQSKMDWIECESLTLDKDDTRIKPSMGGLRKLVH